MYICASLDNPGSLSDVLFQNVLMSVSIILVTGELLTASGPMTSTYLTNSAMYNKTTFINETDYAELVVLCGICPIMWKVTNYARA